MKLLFVLISICAGFLFNVSTTSAQSRSDSIKLKPMALSVQEQRQRQQHFYKSTLKIDSAKALQVTRIQEEYKAGMNALEAEQTIDKETRSARIRSLMEKKNRRLAALLSSRQQDQLIPSGEPRFSPGIKDSTHVK